MRSRDRSTPGLWILLRNYYRAVYLAAPQIVFVLLCGFCLGELKAKEVIPSAPESYLVDEAAILRPETRAELNQVLERFERATSNQMVIAIYPKMLSESSIEDYTVRVAQQWGVGQKAKKNGAVLFVFIQDRKMFIQVGYGLEGALPDLICRQIIQREIVPNFKAGRFDQGIRLAVRAMIQATQGEYQGTGETVGEDKNQKTESLGRWIILILFIFVWILLRGVRSGSSGRWLGGSSGWGSSGGGSGWGGGGGGGGGGFSGGGGSFGGGGSGGSW